MKTTFYTKTISFALLSILSCGKKPVSSTIESEKLTRPVCSYSKIEELTHNMTPRIAEPLKMLYVVNKNAAIQYERPDTNSKVLGEYRYTDNIWVDRIIDTTIRGKKSSWYLINAHITDIKMINSREYSAQFIKPVFVQKKDLGPESKIMMTSNEIYEVQDEKFEPSLRSKKFVSIQSLSHDEFYKEPKPNDWIRTSYTWTYDAVVNDINLKLNKSDTTLQFKNVPFQAETDFHVYMEDLEKLNCYMIFGGYYESHRFILYDKSSGETKANLIGYPCISPDKKYIVSLYDNPYGNGGGELQVHSITSKGPYKLLHSFSFTNWRPFEDPMEFVWINDKEFKLKVYTEYKHFRKWEGKEFAPRTGYLKCRIL